MSSRSRTFLGQGRQTPSDLPWWQPVGLWQSWWGVAFLAVAAALSHWS